MAGNSSVVLMAETGIAGSGASLPLLDLGDYRDVCVMLNCSATPSGGSPTLDVYLQHSVDGGATWRDVAHTQFTTAAAKRFVPICGSVSGGTAIVASSDGAMAGETIVHGPW
ncbi:MAG TPA: hypothetical protein PKC18_15415, partial [Lacipirellulaceae bacterium]|nr:hypothetical protein [Lacipirellulaceae bacterium]